MLATQRDGFLQDGVEHGLFVDQTRLLSRYRFLIDGEPPLPVALSNVAQHSWLGYYLAAPTESGHQRASLGDSGDAIVYDDGTQVTAPIATCEEQGLVYAARVNFAEVLWMFGRRDEAKRLFQAAQELKRRFNDVFWMEREGFIAMAFDSKQRPVRSIASNALHCVATGIVDEDHVPRTMERLFAPDMFSGWGIRTLSSGHPAYNPFSYHRGTVWPVEHGPFAVGAYRYGLHEQVERICRAQFEVAALFEHYRLPE